MKHELPEGAHRVQQFLNDKGTNMKILMLPETTATAQDAAKALGIPVSYIGKSIVFESEKGIIVVILCGDQRVDTDSLARSLNLKDIRTLRADDVKRSTGYVIGGVSPFGLPGSIGVIIDSRLRAFSQCYVAAGHPKAVVKVTTDDLVALTNAKVLPIAI